MSAARDLSLYTKPRGEGRLAMDLAVEGISCGGCMRRIEKALNDLPGVTEARLNFTNRRLAVAWDPKLVEPATVIDTLERMGYGAHPFAARASEDKEKQAAKRLLRYLAVAGFAAMNIMLLSVSIWAGNVSDITPETRDFFHWLSALIALPAVAYAGQPFFRSAFAALRKGSVNMDVPITLGIVLALGLSVYETVNHAHHAYFDSAVALLFFLLCGRYLEQAMRARTRTVAGNLAAYRAETAHKLDQKNQLVEVPAAALKPGDLIVARPGDRIAADGTVVEGTSEIDESLVTGETTPRAMAPGGMVYAGSTNMFGALTVRITAAGENTLLDEIERLLDKAVGSKSRTVRLADWAGKYYAPLVHSAAALTLAGWLIAGAGVHAALVAAISVLIITCPCALALAVPAVQVVAAGRLFRSGLILNSGEAIERLAEIDTVVFDKTGTLTTPETHVANLASVPRDLAQIAARLALSSRHPLAVALARMAEERRPYPAVLERPGEGVLTMIEGVEARLGNRSFCGTPEVQGEARSAASTIAFRYGDRQAVFALEQSLRPGARNAVGRLKALGLDLRILSGDRAEAVAPIAAALGIAEWQASQKPTDKMAGLEASALCRPPRADGRRWAQRCALACRRACLDLADHGRRSVAGACRRGVSRREPRSRL